MLLLSDQGSEARERDREATEVGKEVEEGRKGVAGVVSKLMARQGQDEEGEGGMDVDGRVADSTKHDGQEVEEKDGGEDGEDGEDEDEDEGFEQVA
jgi:hypothetical protein